MAIQELKIIKIEELLHKRLCIPVYQRPYTWQEKTAVVLFEDIYQAFSNKLASYHLGTIILHYSKDENKYNIVDGQQRITTLLIILQLLGQKINLNAKYSSLSEKNIIRNYLYLRTKESIMDIERDKLKKYIDNNCKFALIVTDEQSEAFQFFDSQNSRGKTLEPHDLLKAFHLRAIPDSYSIETIFNLLNPWENKIKKDELKELFSEYLYPIIMWYKSQNGLYYDIEKRHIFEGIDLQSESGDEQKQYNFYKFYRLIQNAVEEDDEDKNLFQLTQPVISGQYFFKYVYYYHNLLHKIKEKVKKFEEQGIIDISINNISDANIYNLFLCSLLLFVDKFNINCLEEDKRIIKILYTWCYVLRITFQRISMLTVNLYVNGKHFDKTANTINIFQFIHEIKNPEDIANIIINRPKKDKINNNIPNSSIKKLEKLKEINNW